MNEPIVWRWTRLIMGFALIIGLVAVHVFLKDLPQVVLGLPALLLGYDLADRFKSGSGTKK